MPVWLGFLWTLPNRLLGFIVGLCTFQTPRLDAHSSSTRRHVVVSAAPLTGTLAVHERHHIKQYCLWGPLFIPVYLLLAIPYGYRRHPMELRAMRAAGELAT